MYVHPRNKRLVMPVTHDGVCTLLPPVKTTSGYLAYPSRVTDRKIDEDSYGSTMYDDLAQRLFQKYNEICSVDKENTQCISPFLTQAIDRSFIQALVFPLKLKPRERKRKLGGKREGEIHEPDKLSEKHIEGAKQ